MPRICTICAHEQRAAVEAALVGNEPLRNIAGDVSKRRPPHFHGTRSTAFPQRWRKPKTRWCLFAATRCWSASTS